MPNPWIVLGTAVALILWTLFVFSRDPDYSRGREDMKVHDAEYRMLTADPGDIIVTVSGKVLGFTVLSNRPGCVLTLTDGTTNGRYYVPHQPHDCRLAFPEGEIAKLQIKSCTKPVDGVYDTFWPGGATP